MPGFERERVFTFTLPELAAGKFTALLARVVARDQYDAVRILEHDPAILDTPEFRLAFTCFAAAAREDARGWSGQLAALDPQDVRGRLVPLLRAAQEPLAGDAEKLAAHLESRLAGVASRLVAWSPGEREFLNALMDHGELTAYPLADERLSAQLRAHLALGQTRLSPLVRGPYVSLSRAFAQGAEIGRAHV